MVKLPCSQWAEVSIDKLRDYCLNPAHEEGRNKAKGFASRLGITASERLALRAWLLEAARGEVALPLPGDQYGQRFAIDFPVVWQRRRAVVRSLWILERGTSAPRLTSCCVL